MPHHLHVRRYWLKSQKIKDDPSSEETQGKNLVNAALKAGVQCFVWSTLPSSAAISGGRLVSRIYEGTFYTRQIFSDTYLRGPGKYHVDAYIKQIGLPACFIYTGNFYENMVLRQHVRYNKDTQVVEFRQPIIKEDTQRSSLSLPLWVLFWQD